MCNHCLVHIFVKSVQLLIDLLEHCEGLELLYTTILGFACPEHLFDFIYDAKLPAMHYLQVEAFG